MDLLIKNGTIVDGSGQEPYKADIAVKDGKIIAISREIMSDSAEIIDAGGKYITPGFIDIHRHADVNLFTDEFGMAELRQGLTTIVNGNCGLSVVPCPKAHKQEIYNFLQPVIGEVPESKDFDTYADYMRLVQSTSLPLNVGMLIGNGTVRAAAKGYDQGTLTAKELDLAQGYLKEALDAGALGVSMGIVYAPENCYDMQGFVDVLQPMKNYNVPLVTHIRGEGDLFRESLLEVIGLANRLGVKLHISHLKCIGKRNWGHGVSKALEILDNARSNGLDVTCDVYPYTAGSTQLIQILPPQYLDGGVPEIVKRLRDADCRKTLCEIWKTPQPYFENLVSSIGWENIYMTTLTKAHNAPYIGLSIQKAAEMRNQTPEDCVCDLLSDEACKISMVDFITSEDDIKTILKYPHSSVISDSVYPNGGIPHPRLFAAFPKILAQYVRDEKVLSIQSAVQKMTSKPAEVYRLGAKGLLTEGFDADINVFSLDNIKAYADYVNPRQYCTGFDYVIINGKTVVRNDEIIKAACGSFISRTN